MLKEIIFLCVRNLMEYFHSVTVVLLIENLNTEISSLPILLHSLRYYMAFLSEFSHSKKKKVSATAVIVF